MTLHDISDVDLRQALVEPGAWTTVYTDGPQGEPPGAVESRMRSLRDRMLQVGVPADDAEAVIDALPDDTGLAAPSARWMLVADGRLRADEGISSARSGPERVTHGPFPDILPLLRHRAATRQVLVVETARDGADVSMQRAGLAVGGSGGGGLDRDEQFEQVQGEDWPLTKSSPGGWSQARFQRSVEETWQRNQDEVAELVDRVVRERRPDHIVVTGDPHARGLLLESISAEALALVVEVDAATRCAGADDRSLIDTIDETLALARDARLAELRDRAAERGGERGAAGTAAVVAALQQAQVETILLDERMPYGEPPLVALPSEPWIAVEGAETFDAGDGIPVGGLDALVRAAVLTDAEVVFLESEPAEGEPFEDDHAARPLAVLRWPSASDSGAAPRGGGDHPSQAEGEDPDDPATRPDPRTEGHPSQAEGEDV